MTPTLPSPVLWPVGSLGSRDQLARRFGPACHGGWPAWAILAWEAGRRLGRATWALDQARATADPLFRGVWLTCAQRRTREARLLERMARDLRDAMTAPHPDGPCPWVPRDTEEPAPVVRIGDAANVAVTDVRPAAHIRYARS